MKNILSILLFTFFGLYSSRAQTPAQAQARTQAMPPAQTSAQAEARTQAMPPAQNHAQATISSDSALNNAFRLVDSVFNRTDFIYDIAEPDIPKDIQGILERFNNAIAANKQWFLDYRQQNANSGQPLPYNDRFGITPGEYNRIRRLEKTPPRLVILSHQNVVVSRDNAIIHFKGTGEALILENLQIIPEKQKIIFGGDTLLFAGPMNATLLTSFSLAHGYTWRLEKADLKTTLQTNKVTAHVVEIDLAVSSETGKTFLRIKYQDMFAGETRADLDLTGFVHPTINY